LIRQLPDQPTELTELKKNLLGQIDEVEHSSRNATQEKENTRIVSRLAAKGVNLMRLYEVARDNDIDVSNPVAFNALLKAVEEQM
jgi:hypothetical protein